jgi:hypothetical protein
MNKFIEFIVEVENMVKSWTVVVKLQLVNFRYLVTDPSVEILLMLIASGAPKAQQVIPPFQRKFFWLLLFEVIVLEAMQFKVIPHADKRKSYLHQSPPLREFRRIRLVMT